MGSDDINKRRIKENREARKRKKLARKANNRLSIPKILILTEGYSEEIYFNQLKNNLRLNTVYVKKSNHTDALRIIEEAIDYGEKSIEQKNEYNYIFCIFDLDTVKNKHFLSTINSYNHRYKKENSIIYPIITYPCIEFWFILHYDCYDTPFNAKRNHSIGDIAKKEFKKYDSNYHETNKNSITVLVTNYKNAIYNAQRVVGKQQQSNSFNPITNIHQLVTLLDNIYHRKLDSGYKYIERIDSYILSQIN
ncbi:hypothetical protein DLE54_09465 [Psychrobacter sp. YP14]|uniref:RloB family protein n=1 Tax=Psychrobacter sp. YP14 TaxID=2203895 RepID=UPI000D7E9B85|nr:RloB family protein [Psychrobacter sp. YP14]AWT49710.1 hypothetical protein DLE54_09465 [Psychrobacter sp. YP14]